VDSSAKKVVIALKEKEILSTVPFTGVGLVMGAIMLPLRSINL
jgi:hypothetical protein